MPPAPQIRRVRAAYGAVLLLVPNRVMERISPTPIDARLRCAARFLGARQLIEGALPRRVRSWLLLVDGLHAISMVGFALFDPRRRTPALFTLAMTAVFASMTAAARDR